MEDFSRQVWEVSHREDEQRLQNSGVIREPCHKSDDVAPDDTDDSAAAGDNDEAGKSFENVRDHQVIFAEVKVCVHHVIQHLQDKTVKMFWKKLESKPKFI